MLRCDDQVAQQVSAYHFSSRVNVGEFNPISLEERRLTDAGISFTSLNDANPTHHGLAPDPLAGPYVADPRGPRAVRQALAALHQPSCDPDRIYAMSSTSQAYSWIIKLLCDPGDAILVPTPGYPLVPSIARLEGVTAMPYHLDYDGSWCIDVAGVSAAIESSSRPVRALVVINPNNPTASYVKDEERARLVRCCAERGVAVIADEVFFDFALDAGISRRRFAGEDGVLTFALDGFSKMLAAPHVKVGWIQVSGPQQAVAEAQRRLDVIADDFLPFSDLIAQRVPALADMAHTQVARVESRISDNLRRLRQLLDDDPQGLVSLMHPEGGWNVLLRMPATLDEDALVLSLIRRSRITGQPGYFFDMPSAGFIAVSLLPEPEHFVRMLRQLLAVVREAAVSTGGVEP